MTRLKDLSNRSFGLLTVKSRAENSKGGKSRWNCVCDCGNITTVQGSDLSSNHTRSCGCLGREMLKNGDIRCTHGMNGTQEYLSWQNAKQRCANPNNKRYNDYGGVTKSCSQWSRELGGQSPLVYLRLKRGWSEEKAVSTPARNIVRQNYHK